MKTPRFRAGSGDLSFEARAIIAPMLVLLSLDIHLSNRVYEADN